MESRHKADLINFGFDLVIKTIKDKTPQLHHVIRWREFGNINFSLHLYISIQKYHDFQEQQLQSHVDHHDMKNNEMYKDYNNVLGHDGLCMGTDKWTDQNDFCSDGKKKED